MSTGEKDCSTPLESKQVFPFATAYTKAATLSGAALLLLFAAFLVPMLLAKHKEGAEIGGLLGGIAMLVVGFALLALYGRYIWTTRIELSGDTVLYISGKRRTEAPLREIAALKRFETENGYAYRIQLQNGQRIDFNSGIENADTLCRHIERATGKHFTD